MCWPCVSYFTLAFAFNPCNVVIISVLHVLGEVGDLCKTTQLGVTDLN